MDIIILGFLFLLTLVFLFYGLLRANPLALLAGGIFLVLFSVLVYGIGYDVDYNPVTSTSSSVFSYDANQLLQNAQVQIYQVNGTNSVTIHWFGIIGMFMGALLSLFSILGLVSRSGR